VAVIGPGTISMCRSPPDGSIYPSHSGFSSAGSFDKAPSFSVRSNEGNSETGQHLALDKVFEPVGWAKLVCREAAAHQWVGRRAKKDGACVGRPRLGGLEVGGYAALAFLVAVGRAGFGWAFAAVFLAACAFSFAVNSALTFWAMASVSTL